MIRVWLAKRGASMRGSDERNGSLFSFVDLEERIPAGHPLRKILEIVNAALTSLDADFARLYAADGRPSIAPERLLRAVLIQILFSIRSERQLMEQMQYNLLFRWFVGLGIDDPVWAATVFTKNRDWLLNTDIARKFLAAILANAQVAPLLSDDHFSVDGTLVEAWASMKRFLPKTEDGDQSPPPDAPGRDGSEEQIATRTANALNTANEKLAMTTTEKTNGQMAGRQENERNADVDFRGQKRSNATHASLTNGDARVYRKGKGKHAQLCYMGHALMENRHGLIVEAELTQADGYGERAAAITMIERHVPGSTRRLMLGADKGYDASGFVADLRRMCVTPHIASKKKGSAIDGRTTRHAGYAVSQRKRKQIEEPFGWAKTVGYFFSSLLMTAWRQCSSVA